MAERTLRTRLEAETSQWSARMAAAQAQLERMERAPVAAARGMGMLRSGMQSLAFEAIGVPGPLGKVTQALGLFALGSPVMLGVMAGIGAFAVAARTMRDDLEGIEKRAAGASKELATLLAKAGSNVAIRQQLTGFGAEPGVIGQLAEARKELARLQTAPLGFGITPQDALNRRLAAIVVQEQLVHDLDQKRLLLTQQLAEAHEEIAEKGLAKEAQQLSLVNQAMLLQLELANDIKEVFESIQPVDVSQFLAVPASWEIALQRGRFGAAAFQGPQPTGFGAVRFHPRPEEPGVFGDTFNIRLFDALGNALIMDAAALKRHADAADRAAMDQQQAAAMAIMGIGSAVQGLIAGTRGGAGGFFGGLLGLAGGIVGVAKGVNPIIGASMIGGGGIISALAARGERQTRPISVHDAAARRELERLREELRNRRPVQVHTYLIDPRTGSIRELQEGIAVSEHFDAVSRFGAGNVVNAGA